MIPRAQRPVPKIEEDFYDWWERHREKCALVAERKDWDLVFLGDSITHMFELETQGVARGRPVWERDFSRFRPLNLGFGWDRTQNLLWRLENGEFEGLHPRFVVLLIGTNNLGGSVRCPAHSPQETAIAIRAVCESIHERSSASRILLHPVLPRGSSSEAFRPLIAETNALTAGLVGDLSFVKIVDFGASFLDASKEIPTGLMNDLCHPTRDGYELWAEALFPHLDS